MTHQHAETLALTDPEYCEIVLAVVEKAYRVRDVTVKDRHRPISEARQLAMFLCRELTTSSYPAIGDIFNRDHTTVLHAARVHTKRLAGNKRYAEVVGRVIETIQREAVKRSAKL